MREANPPTPLDDRETRIWTLEASLKCKSCKGRYAPPVHMVKLTETQENHAISVDPSR